MGKEFETRVIFKMTPDAQFITERECIAFLPDIPSNEGNIMSYMHVGQHSEASVGFYHDCTPATDEQFANLREELESIGYRLYLRNSSRKYDHVEK